MSTNSDYFKDSLQLLGVLAEGESVSAEQGATMLRVLNGMLDSMRDIGIDFGIPPQSSTSATVFLTEGTVEAFKYMLAVRAASVFEVPIPPEVAMYADMHYGRLLRKAVYASSQVRDMDHTPYRRGGGYNIETDQ